MSYLKSKLNHILFLVISLLILTTFFGCTPAPDTTLDTTPPATEPATSYAIDYDLQGYLFIQGESSQRVFVENASFTARNPTWPKEMKDGEMNSDKTSFEYLSVRGFPIIENETALSTYKTEPRNGLYRVDVTLPGSKRDHETGELLLTIEARYVMFIDEETNELLLCHIYTDMDGEDQQYFFSPVNNLDYINDIMIRGYT